MSNALAVAQATGALKEMLSRAVADDIDVAVQVEARRPLSDAPANPTITVFCYRIEPNAHMRNADTPTRNAAGVLVKRPSAAVDMHYLISCHPPDGVEFVAEAMLGSVMRALHEQPILSADDLAAAAPQLPPLGEGDLTAAAQRVRLTPSQMDLDDLSKLWAMFPDTPYVPSIAYMGTLVMLEGRERPAAGLPVAEHRVRVLPGSRPVIERLGSRPVGSTDEPALGPVPSGNEVVVDGRHFVGDRMLLRIGGTELPADRAGEGRLVVELPADVPAGIHPVRVLSEVDFEGEPRLVDSTARAMGRQATVVDTTVTAGPPPEVSVRVDVSVADDQRATLLLDELDSPLDPPRSFRFDAAFPLPGGRDPDTVPFVVDGVPAGDYLLRVEIDGVQSPISSDYTEPAVTL